MRQASAFLRCPQSGRWKGLSAAVGRHVEILWRAAPQSVRSSHSLKMQEQLLRLSLSQWAPQSRAAVSSYLSTAANASNLSILHDNWHAKGRAADAAGTKRFSYSRATEALLCLSLTSLSRRGNRHQSRLHGKGTCVVSKVFTGQKGITWERNGRNLVNGKKEEVEIQYVCR